MEIGCFCDQFQNKHHLEQPINTVLKIHRVELINESETKVHAFDYK